MLPQHRDYIHKGVDAGMRFSMNVPSGTFEGGLGSKLGVRTGNSLEFMEHRDYIAGDDLRQLDWNVYARTDKLTVKLYREEVTPALDIVIDTSQSMHLETTEKSNSVIGIAALLATAGGNADFNYNTWTHSPSGFNLVDNGNAEPALWNELYFNQTINPEQSLQSAPPPFQHHGVRILISDLLWMGDPHNFLSRFSIGASAVIVIQVLAEQDIKPHVEGNVQLIDSETGESQEIFMDSHAIQNYKNRLSRHQQSWSASCREAGAVFTSVCAEDIVNDWILSDLINHEILRIH